MADNVKITYAFLRRKGLSAQQAAGVIGGLQGESGKNLDPGAVNPSSGATGIGQWLGGRKNAAVMTKRLQPQLNHLWDELQGPERGAFEKLKRARTVDQAVDIWVRDFERPSSSEIASSIGGRKASARNVLRSLGNKNIPSGGSQDSSGGTITRVTTPGITIGAGSRIVDDPEAQKRVILANLIKQRQPDSPLLKLGILDPNESTTKTVDDPGVTIPGVTKTTRTTSGSLTGGGSAVSGSSHSPLFELIHNTGNGPGFAVKNGQKVNGAQFYSQVWAGHKDHVHVAAGPNTVVKLGKMAQEMGLNVGENPHFGPVHKVHSANSYHYKNEAIDVSGDPQKMNRYARRVEQVFGIH